MKHKAWSNAWRQHKDTLTLQFSSYHCVFNLQWRMAITTTTILIASAIQLQLIIRNLYNALIEFNHLLLEWSSLWTIHYVSGTKWNCIFHSMHKTQWRIHLSLSDTYFAVDHQNFLIDVSTIEALHSSFRVDYTVHICGKRCVLSCWLYHLLQSLQTAVFTISSGNVDCVDTGSRPNGEFVFETQMVVAITIVVHLTPGPLP